MIHMWVGDIREAVGPDYYNRMWDLTDKEIKPLPPTGFLKQVDLDLLRTFPTNKYFLRDGPAINKLRRILVAFMRHSPRIGGHPARRRAAPRCGLWGVGWRVVRRTQGAPAARHVPRPSCLGDDLLLQGACRCPSNPPPSGAQRRCAPRHGARAPMAHAAPVRCDGGGHGRVAGQARVTSPRVWQGVACGGSPRWLDIVGLWGGHWL